MVNFEPRIEYVADLGWPWTSDKAMTECKWCFKGPGVFVNIKDSLERPVAGVHPWCMSEIGKVEA